MIVLIPDQCLCIYFPRSGKNVGRMKFFPGQGKVREFCGWPGKFRKALEIQGIWK